MEFSFFIELEPAYEIMETSVLRAISNMMGTSLYYKITTKPSEKLP
jgi:hypothetical protein